MDNNNLFTGNKYTKNGHAETILPAVFRQIKITYKRLTINLPDGDFLDLDFCLNNNDKILVLFHGLEGSSNSNYMKGFATYFNKLGFDICAVNFRSCSGRLNYKLHSYHSGHTQDLVEVFNAIETLNYTKIFAGGFSIGGNVLLKFLGEPISNAANIDAAFAFSVPIDLEESTQVLAKPANYFYMKHFLKSLNKKITQKAKQYPNLVSLKNLKNIKTFYQWDSEYTAPINGFKNATDYYAKCSSKQYINRIKVPTLLVNALNDPFLGTKCLTVLDKPKNFIFETPKYGGHCGFSYNTPNGNYYSEERVETFLNRF